MMEITFDRLIEPIGRDRFFEEYHGKTWLHVKGAREISDQVMSWDELGRLMSMRAIWSPATFRVMLDRKALKTEDYCSPLVATGGASQMRPDPKKLGPLIRRGVSVVLNDVSTHTAGAAAVADALQEATGGSAQSNLYFSMSQRQAFGPHNDAHDVFALHCCGEKIWHIYETKEDSPIAHPRFQRSFEESAKMAGPKVAEVKMEPGDLLYIPRGQFHDALASQNGAVHIAFGVTMPKMIDLLTPLWEASVSSAKMRADLPVKPDIEQLSRILSDMGDELKRISQSPQMLRMCETLLAGFGYENDYLDLESLLEGETSYKVNGDIRFTKVQGKPVLARGKEGVEVPGEMVEQVAWVMGREQMRDSDLAHAFPAMADSERQEFIGSLLRMNVLR
ncbi:MAG: cupin domain-containing protein [Limibacillus sp.]|jgi:ribosomal protein L16 Arg81 hydroxylase